MELQQFQSIKDLAMNKVQQRLNATPGIKEDLTRKFADWFQNLVQQAKLSQTLPPAEPLPQEGA
jgi:hypothetical protein